MVGLVLFGGMLVLMLLGIPIVFAIGLASVLGTLVIGAAAPWIIIPSSMINGMDSFPLMAVPFFILAGELMNRGGIAERLVAFANSLVGHIRGGLGHATVVSNTMLAHGHRLGAGTGGRDRPDHDPGHGEPRLSRATTPPHSPARPR